MTKLWTTFTHSHQIDTMLCHLKLIVFSYFWEKFTDEFRVKTYHPITLHTFHMLMVGVPIIYCLILIVSFSQIDSAKKPEFTKSFECTKYTCPPNTRKLFFKYWSRNKMLWLDKRKYLFPFLRPSFPLYFHIFKKIIDTKSQ